MFRTNVCVGKIWGPYVCMKIIILFNWPQKAQNYNCFRGYDSQKN